MNPILQAIANDENIAAEFRAALPVGHTPGPWLLDGPYPIRIMSADGYVVCDGIMPSGAGNARLIAAAPELLAALQWAMPRLQEVGGDDNPEYVKAMAAIKKATT